MSDSSSTEINCGPNAESVNSDSNDDTTSSSYSSEGGDDMINNKLTEKLKKSIVTDNNIHKCVHKVTKCMIVSPCCKQEFKCRRCHDKYFEDNDEAHKLDTKKIKQMVCDYCLTLQDVSNKCTTCDIKFSDYYCDICKIHNDKPMFHCEKCDECILGNKFDYKHCNTCKCCIFHTVYDTHKCITDRLKGNCSICLESFENGERNNLMKCGHTIHYDCYTQYIKSSYKCPVCQKTIKDMSDEFRNIDRSIEFQPMPEMKRVHIKCNDCEQKSKPYFHHVGLKCEKCGSYNTYKIN